MVSKDNLKKWIGHPRFELFQYARISGNKVAAMQKLDATSSEEDGFISAFLKKMKCWFLTHSQHLNFFTIFLLASCYNQYLVKILRKAAEASRYSLWEIVPKNGTCKWVRLDGKTQVTVEYRNDNGAMIPLRVHTVLISTQHDESVTNEQIAKDLMEGSRNHSQCIQCRRIDDTIFFNRGLGHGVLI